MSGDTTSHVDLGTVVTTAAVAAQLAQEETAVAWLSERILTDHQCGQWGNVPPEDADANDHALTSGARVLSAYDIPAEIATNCDADTIWIITEAKDQDGQRQATTVLYPHEY